MTRKAIATCRGISLALAICVGAFAAAGCGGSDDANGSGAAAAKNLRIAFFTDSLDNAYLQAGMAAAKDVAAKRGVKLDVISAGWDPNKQLTQIQDAVTSQRYDALVVESIDGQVTCKTLTRAAKQMVVSIYNAPICGNYADLFTPGTVGFFGRNEYAGGMMMADQVAKAIGKKGTVGYISGPVQAGIVKNGTTAGIKARLKQYPGVKLVAELDGAWDPAKGLGATQDLIQAHPDVDAIIFGVDQMAVPSIAWLKKNHKLGDRKIVTLGGTTQGLQLIQEGSIYSSINSLPREEAAYAVEAAVDKLQNKPIAFPGWDGRAKVYDVLKDPRQPPILDKSNVAGITAQWGV